MDSALDFNPTSHFLQFATYEIRPLLLYGQTNQHFRYCGMLFNYLCSDDECNDTATSVVYISVIAAALPFLPLVVLHGSGGENTWKGRNEWTYDRADLTLSCTFANFTTECHEDFKLLIPLIRLIITKQVGNSTNNYYFLFKDTNYKNTSWI